VAVREGERTVSYAQLWEGVGLAQRYLEAQGVGTGDRVLIAARTAWP
jgi:long-subunit acyl-CoA synthetase (AMP-forming)